MDIQNVPKVGISSVVHSKHIDVDSIDVIDNDIALLIWRSQQVGGIDNRTLPGR